MLVRCSCSLQRVQSPSSSRNLQQTLRRIGRARRRRTRCPFAAPAPPSAPAPARAPPPAWVAAGRSRPSREPPCAPAGTSRRSPRGACGRASGVLAGRAVGVRNAEDRVTPMSARYSTHSRRSLNPRVPTGTSPKHVIEDTLGDLALGGARDLRRPPRRDRGSSRRCRRRRIRLRDPETSLATMKSRFLRRSLSRALLHEVVGLGGEADEQPLFAPLAPARQGCPGPSLQRQRERALLLLDLRGAPPAARSPRRRRP